MRRYKVYKSYDPDGRFFSFSARTVTGNTSLHTSSLKDLADYVKKDRQTLHVDLVIDFNADNNIDWSADESQPRRHAPLSVEEQEEFFRLLAN